MKCRPTPLMLAISLAFQPHLAYADEVGQTPALTVADANSSVQDIDLSEKSSEQPVVEKPKKKRNWKFWQSKKSRAAAEASPVAYTVSELDAAQIQEKLDELKLPQTVSNEISEKSTRSRISVKNKKIKDLAPKKQRNAETAAEISPENDSVIDKTEHDAASGSLKEDNAAETASVAEAKTETATEAETPKKKRNWKFWQKNQDKKQNHDEPEEGGQEQDLPQKYPITVKTEQPEITALLEQHLPIISYQKREEMDDEQISYLAEDTPKDVQNLVRTEGYFNAKTKVTQQPETKGYDIDVSLGARTVIDNVNVAIVGDVLQDDQLGNYYKQALSGWKLPVGANFRQEDWSSSKVSVLSAVTRKKYPLAKLAQTQATINPNTQKADLNVLVESHQPVYFGEMMISGYERYPKSVISGLADFKAGDDYDLDKLLDYQQALENDSHYSGASVQADFDSMVDNRVPVKVEVSEVKRQKVEAGLRFDSEYGLGGQISYDHYNLFNRGYIGSVSVEADKYQTLTGVGISQPRDSKGRYFTSNLTYNRSTTQRLEKRAISTGIWHVQDRNDTEWRFGLEFLGEDSRIPDTDIELGKSFATMVTAQWKKHNLETQMRPQNGYYADVKLGSTVGKIASSAMMARALAQGGYYFTPENKKLSTIVIRGNLGYVYTNEDDTNGQVPTGLMFRTGGASTVRGYELDSIGLNIPNSSTVLPNRAMAVASFEYQYPIQKKLMGQEFAVAVFHDVGGVARTFNHMQWKHGTGLGLRWFSPVAPFSFDIAYGHQDKKLRWHISLGTRF